MLAQQSREESDAASNPSPSTTTPISKTATTDLVHYPDVRHRTGVSRTKQDIALPIESASLSDTLDGHLHEEEKYKHDYMEKRDALLRLLSGAYNLLSEMTGGSQACYDYLQYCAQLPVPPELCLAASTPYHLFRVDLKPTGSRSSSRAAQHLDQSTNAELLDQKMKDCLVHLDRIKDRIRDTRSKVLVTGDINSGKSTLINALLRRDILPHDQQPCTAAICEVIDAFVGNEGREEVHAIVDPARYDRSDPSTFTSYPIDQLLQAHQDHDEYQLWKIYLKHSGDRRSEVESEKDSSILHNSVVDITLIDSPGLNRDLTQTMAVFAQQEAIDAVVFVVNAENHVTLSGVDFLAEAKHEKPLMFMAINRYDAILDKERCRMEVIDQLQHLLPETLSQSDELVHFVSARQYLKKHIANTESDPDDLDIAFINMETCLRSFLLEKRIQSKLVPAATYMAHLFADVVQLTEINETLAGKQYHTVASDLDKTTPVLRQLSALNETYSDEIDKAVEDTTQRIYSACKHRFDQLLQDLPSLVASVSYPGLFYARYFAEDVVQKCDQHLKTMILQSEDDAVELVNGSIASLHSMANLVVSEFPSLDKSLEMHPQMIRTQPDEIMDRRFLDGVQIETSDYYEVPRNLVSVTLGVSTVSVIGGNYIGYHRIGNMIMGFSRWFGLQSVKSVALGAVTCIGLGTAIYFINDMQRSLQHKLTAKISRKIRRSEPVMKHLNRIVGASRKGLAHTCAEFRKVAGHALDECRARTRDQQESLEKAERTRNYFRSMKTKAVGLKVALEAIDVSERIVRR